MTTDLAALKEVSPPEAPARASNRRADIQGLRAVAVLLVVAFHAKLPVPGGFVGVDVFFVISGFLISQHLLGELRRTGRVRLGAFYARRARRLLPASLSVLLIVAAVVPFALPREQWGDSGRSVLATAFYAVNFYAAHLTSLGGQAAFAHLPTVHYWSLSLEEQFYVVWPLVVAGLLALRRGSRTVLTWVVGAGWVISLVACGVLNVINDYSNLFHGNLILPIGDV